MWARKPYRRQAPTPSPRSSCRAPTSESQNGNIVAQGDANIKDPGKAIGSNVFVWQGGDPNGSTWDGMGFHDDAEGATAPNTPVLERIEGSPDVMDAIRKRMKPGTVLVTTDAAATADTRSGEDFVVMDGPGK